MLRIQIFMEGVAKGQVKLTEADFPALIGRSEDASVFIDDRSVSRRHAQLTLAVDKVVITDLGSGNGTYFGKRSVETRVIEHKDEATIGAYKLLFELESKMRPRKAASPYDSVKGDEGGLTMKMSKQKMREVSTRQAIEKPAYLVQLAADRQIPLKGQVCFIGSVAANDIIIKGWGVALRHALILKEGLAYRLIDLTGKKRIRIGEEWIENIKLTKGTRFKIGRSHEFEFLEGTVKEELKADYEQWFKH